MKIHEEDDTSNNNDSNEKNFDDSFNDSLRQRVNSYYPDEYSNPSTDGDNKDNNQSPDGSNTHTSDDTGKYAPDDTNPPDGIQEKFGQMT